MASVVALVAAVPAFAQSCPMCYNAAASTKASAIQALRSGTLILIFPVLFIFAGILFVVYRSRNRFNAVEAGGGEAWVATVSDFLTVGSSPQKHPTVNPETIDRDYHSEDSQGF